MKQLVWMMTLGVVAYCSPQYFLYQEAVIPRDIHSESTQEKTDFYIKATPMFFKPKMHSYNRGVLIYDLYHISNHHSKQFEGIKVVGGVSLNKIYASKFSQSTPSRWIIGSGIYLNTSRNRGLGALVGHSYTTLSAEIRARIATQLLLSHSQMLEFSLQLPIFGVRLFGYDASKGDNALFMIRFLYGD